MVNNMVNTFIIILLTHNSYSSYSNFNINL